MPIVDVLKTHPGNVLRAMGMRIAENGVFYITTVFALTYGEAQGVDRNTMLTGVVIRRARPW